MLAKKQKKHTRNRKSVTVKLLRLLQLYRPLFAFSEVSRLNLDIFGVRTCIHDVMMQCAVLPTCAYDAILTEDVNLRMLDLNKFESLVIACEEGTVTFFVNLNHSTICSETLMPHDWYIIVFPADALQ